MRDLAVAYVRVSSKKQNIDRQIEELAEYAKSINLKLIDNFKDTVSSFKYEINDRSGYKKMKSFLLDENNNVKNVLVHEVSRLGRKNFEVQNTIEEFYKYGINIHFKDLKLSTLDEKGKKSPEASIIISILGSMAENENRQLRDRIKSSLLSCAKKGLAFNPKITGYNKGLDGKPEIDKEVAPIIRRMFELAASGTSLYYISKQINSEFNKLYHPKTINGIIKNSFYKGERKYLGESILVDNIVDNRLWQKANNYLNSRKKFTKKYRVNENIVEGKIECYNCEKTMHQIVIEKSRCNIFKCSGDCSTSVNRPWLYEMIRYVVEKHNKELRDEKYKNNLVKKIKENDLYINDLTKELKEVKRKQIRNYDNYLDNKVSEELYDEKRITLDNDINRLNKTLNELIVMGDSFSLALKKKPKHFSDELKTFKVQIQDVVESVEVSDDFVRININNTLIYKIPQLSPSRMGWIKRKNKGAKNIFESPFITGVKIINFISDEDLNIMIDNEINDYEDLIDEYIESE